MSNLFRRFVLDGRYALDAELGEGHLGTLYRGTDSLEGTGVLIYAYQPGSPAGQEEGQARFLEAARFLQTVTHPSLARVRRIDTYQEQGLLYAVMEPMAGRTLRRALATRRPVEAGTAFQVASQLAQALQVLHRHNLIHGSLSPETVLVSADLGTAVLWDVSLARRAAASPLRVRLLTPRFGYISPEQMRGEPVDARADIYLLGCLLYEMLADRRVFQAATPEMTWVYHRSMAPDQIEAYCPGLHPEHARLVMAMLQKNPANRPQTLDQVLHTLQLPVEQPAAHHQPGPPPTDRAPAEPDSPSRPTTAGHFQLATGEVLPLPAAKDEAWIGRQDANTEPPWLPDVDLSPEPHAQTVSRRHARLLRAAGGWRLVPQPDANPTVLNQQLVADTGEALYDGDQVQFGLVKLVYHAPPGPRNRP